jgi:hypothetical protein
MKARPFMVYIGGVRSVEGYLTKKQLTVHDITSIVFLEVQLILSEGDLDEEGFFHGHICIVGIEFGCGLYK